MADDIKVGLISCSGEEISEGTLSRAAVRIVLEKLRPLQTVTICLPLFLAGDSGERAFAQRYPTITVDGCGKRCAQKCTEKYSGKVDDVIVIDEILKDMGEKAPASRRDFTEQDWALAEKVAQVIAHRVDIVLAKAAQEGRGWKSDAAPLPECACSSGPPECLHRG
ncbi:MAG: putative zinc-binding protein [Candidatus Xenobiia bacterium LiM19]